MGVKRTDHNRSRKPTSSIVLPKVICAIATLGLILAMAWSTVRWKADNPIGISHQGSDLVEWNRRREEVKKAFITSWDAYSRHAWGHDRYHSISETGSQMSPDGLGWIIVDSLDTMMIMNLTSRVVDAGNWIEKSLHYDQDQDVNTFETTIRMLGGLLSAHYLTTRLPDVTSAKDLVYLKKSIDLAERLLPAYTSRSGIPYASVHLGRRQGLPSHADGGASSMAEAGALQLEMKYLSHLTGNETYWRKAERVMQVLDDNGARDGLLPIFVHPETGRFTTAEIRLGSRGNSHYEYLIKQYLPTSRQEPVYLDMWDEAVRGIRKHLVTVTKGAGLKFVAELPNGIGGKLSPKWTTCADKEDQMELGRDLAKTCWGSRSFPPVRDSPEAWKADYIIKPLDAHNLQRPETVESLFVMWRVTGDPVYREWGWKTFTAFEKHAKARGGYTSLYNVNAVPSPKRENMESFWLAETLKYFYLLFSQSDFFPLDEVVFNTEAHILPVFKSRWSTGWSRKHRPVKANS